MENLSKEAYAGLALAIEKALAGFDEKIHLQLNCQFFHYIKCMPLTDLAEWSRWKKCFI